MKTGQEDEAPRAEELNEKWMSRAGTELTQSNHRCKKFTKFANFNFSPKAAITIIKIFANPWIQGISPIPPLAPSPEPSYLDRSCLNLLRHLNPRAISRKPSRS